MNESSFLCFDIAIRNLSETAFELSSLSSLLPGDQRLRLHTNILRIHAGIARLQQLVMDADMRSDSLSDQEKSIVGECACSQRDVAQCLHELTYLIPDLRRDEFRDAVCALEGIAAVLSEIVDDGSEQLSSTA
jgi:hypothetical protein